MIYITAIIIAWIRCLWWSFYSLRWKMTEQIYGRGYYKHYANWVHFSSKEWSTMVNGNKGKQKGYHNCKTKLQTRTLCSLTLEDIVMYYTEPLDGALCNFAAAVAAKSLQSCLTLCDPIDSSPPGSPVHGILQARTLEWVAISFSNAWKWKVKVKSLSRVWLVATSWTAAYQAPPSMGFSRQEYCSGLPFATAPKF